MSKREREGGREGGRERVARRKRERESKSKDVVQLLCQL